MSDSKQKTPIISWTKKKSCEQKRFRQHENRAKRRCIKTKIRLQDFDNMPHEKEFGNEWDSPRDGKQYLKEDREKWMRK